MTIGSFLRVVDAVKGPFYPSPPAFPTYMLKDTDADFPKEAVFAPLPENDVGVPVECVDPY